MLPDRSRGCPALSKSFTDRVDIGVETFAIKGINGVAMK